MMYNNFADVINAGPLLGLGFGAMAIGAMILFMFLALAILALKGYALWVAAQRGEKGWFIAILIINTLGILELCYLYFVVGKWKNKNITKTDTNNTSVPPSEPSHQ